MLQNHVRERVRNPTVHLDVGNALIHRLVQDLSCCRREVISIYGHFGSTMPSKGSTLSSNGSGWGTATGIGVGLTGVAEGLRGGLWRISRARRAFLVFCSDSFSTLRISSMAWNMRGSS